ncbi:hypothetical protein Pfo_022475 [Paulownia fortunei]|nr:hypothetical protein Pfo_022475 [Paulownia fortunei]
MMPAQKRGEGGEGSQNLLNRRGGRRRKQPPVRFGGAAAAQHPPPPPHQEQQHAPQQQLPQQIQENPQADMETDESGTDPEEFDEVVAVSLSELRNNVQCPICLGIIKKTRTVMGCLHRFCRECIDKSMRLGNNECPACRIHCASRRSLRDDPDFDTFVSSVFPDVEKYEEEELVLHEEERAVNEQIQASIGQISLRQSEALVRVRKMGRDAGASTSRVPRNCRKSYSRRSVQNVRFDDSSKNQDEIDRVRKALVDEYQPEFSQMRRGQCGGVFPIQTPCTVADVEDAEVIQSSAEPTTEHIRCSPCLVNPGLLTWGRAGVRSHTRHGGANSSKVTRSNRIQKLADHLTNVEKNDYEHVAPVITTQVQSDEMLWLKDYRTSSPNPSSSMAVLKSPPQVVRRFSEEFKSFALPSWILA